MASPPQRQHDLEQRLTRLETALPYIEEDLREARGDIRTIKRSAIATLWSVLFAVLLAIFGATFAKWGAP
ncbi:MAG TPA: hypothetical protein VK652_16860 [Steroidobacteraceae bacterium]|nr:hypothetical protein [Steroidobacteraceae bacterium]